MSFDVLDQVPPQNLEAEQAVLGAMLLDRTAIMKADELLAVDDFYRLAHQAIYEAILNIYNRREPVDLITIGDWLRTQGKLDEVGGSLYLTTIMAQCPTYEGVKHYAQIVRTKSIQRNLIRVAEEIKAAAYEGADEVDDLLTFSEQRVLTVGDKQTRNDGPLWLADIAKDVYYQRESEIEEGVSNGFKTPWIAPNGFLTPVRAGQLVILCGRPGTFKTTLAVQWGKYLASNDIPGCIFSLEMEKGELSMRVMLGEMRTTQDQLDDMEYCQQHKTDVLNDLADAVERVWNLHIAIDDRPGLTVTEMASVVRRLKREKGIKWVIVDFLQLASSGKKSSNRFEEVGQLAYDLKAMAKSCGVAVIALSQLSREVERESPRRPQMSHLLESGKIEAAADKILYLYRPAYYGPDECEKAGFPTEDECSGFIEIGLLKQRAGKPRGKTVVNFVGQYTIADLTPHQWHIYSQAEARIQR